MGLLNAVRRSVQLSKRNALTPTDVASLWPNAIELRHLEAESPRLLCALGARLRSKLALMFALKLLYYAAELLGPYVVGLVSVEYRERQPSDTSVPWFTVLYLACRFVVLSCQSLSDMVARLCGVEAMGLIMRWVFRRMLMLPSGLINPATVTNLAVGEEVRSLTVMGVYVLPMALSMPFRIAAVYIMQALCINPIAWAITTVMQVLHALLQGWIRRRINRVIVRKNQAADLRLKCVEEAIDEMKITKFLGQEEIREARLSACRAREGRLDGLVVILNQIASVVGLSYAMLHPVLGLVLHYLLERELLDPMYAWWYWSLNIQSISLLSQLFGLLPMISNTLAALRRYRAFGALPLRPARSEQPDRRRSTVPVAAQYRRRSTGAQAPRPSDHDSPLRLTGSEYAFHNPTDAAPKPVLWSPNLAIRPGEVCLVVGPTGSGKSSLLLALLGELGHDGHDVTSRDLHGGTCGYTSQQVVLFARSIRENVVNGRAFRPAEYKDALAYSCLERDLEQIDGKDSAMIASGGSSLSGGQQMRVALARSFYALFSASRTSHRVLLADDPLAALDSKVSAAVFDKGFMHSLHGCTRVITMGMPAFLDHPAVDTILVVQQGRIAFRGSVSELLQVPDNPWLTDALKHCNLGAQWSRGVLAAGQAEQPIVGLESYRRRAAVLPESLITHSEDAQVGGIDAATVKRLVSLGGCWFFVVVFGFFTCQRGALLYFNYEATLYVEAKKDPVTGTLLLCAIVGAILIVQVLYCFVFARRGQLVITRMLELAFGRVMRCPLPVLQNKSKGEIMSRLTEAVSALKRVLESAQNFLNALFMLAISLLYTVPVFWPSLFGVFVSGLFVWRFGRIMVPTSRDLQRCTAQSKTPVHAVLSECIKGSVTLRALQSEEEARRRYSKAVQLSLTCTQTNIMMTELIGFALAMYSFFYLSTIVTFLWVARDWVITLTPLGASSFVFVINGMSNLGMQIKGLLQGFIPVEAGLIAAQRINEYIDKLEQEADHDVPGVDDSLGAWPTHGRLELCDVSLKYRPSLPLSLKYASFSIPSGSSLGIVGRSGAGKSTIISALLRLVEPCGGSVHIDGVDISTVGLRRLRKSIAIMPQEPTLLAGTLRSNLDASNSHPDETLWSLLATLELQESVRALPDGLQTGTEMPNSAPPLLWWRAAACMRR